MSLKLFTKAQWPITYEVDEAETLHPFVSDVPQSNICFDEWLFLVISIINN